MGQDSKKSATKVIAVVAAADNGVIGCNGELPWKLASDLRRFRELTTGHPIIVGRKTFESIGKPLPRRASIVLSRGPWEYDGESVVVASSLEEAIKKSSEAEGVDNKQAFVIGGGEIYRLALPHTDRIHLTRVHTKVEGDATFPELDPAEWRLTSSEEQAADDKNEHACTFEVWERLGD